MAKIYDFKALNNKGLEFDFAQFEGKVLLIVNTASKCGFTPQYDGLEALYQKYKDRGLAIVGFPCDQFAHQEPGSDEESPVYTYLKSAAPTEEYKGLKAKATHKLLKGLSKSVEKDSDILWNFTKFLISRDGTIVKRFAPVAEPASFEKDIEEML